MRKKVVLSWSSGKDSTLCLHYLTHNSNWNQKYQVKGLLTTVTADFDRVAMHSTRLQLLESQAKSLNLPLIKVSIPKNCSNEIYQKNFLQALDEPFFEDVEYLAFGDLFLEDVKNYRDSLLKEHRLQALYPLWNLPTPSLAQQFIELGYQAHLSCVDPKQLDPKFCGVAYDLSFLKALSSNVDPCGENGEFHTIVSSGPLFQKEIPVNVQAPILRDGFWFSDIIPSS